MQRPFTEDHRRLRSSVRALLDQASPTREVRRVMETATGHDRALWEAMSELGLQGIAVPTELGGAGGSVVGLAVVFEEMGRALACVPYLSTVGLATRALLASGDDSAVRELVPAMASGALVATVAAVDDGGPWEQRAVTATATRTARGYRLDGESRFVVDGHTADVLVVGARTGGGISLLTVDGSAPGVDRQPLPTMDRTRRLARVVLSDAPARLVGQEGEGWPALSHARSMGAMAVAAEQAGGASRCLEMTVRHVKGRRQFGRPVGSFQAVKHSCADMVVEVEHARSAAYHAAWTAAGDGGDLPLAASVAKAYCSEAFLRVATATIHLHGAVGFTWDHDAHLYYRRALSSRVLLGDPAHHREEVARHIGLCPPGGAK